MDPAPTRAACVRIILKETMPGLRYAPALPILIVWVRCSACWGR
jgi:hypothetical protein